MLIPAPGGYTYHSFDVIDSYQFVKEFFLLEKEKDR